MARFADADVVCSSSYPLGFDELVAAREVLGGFLASERFHGFRPHLVFKRGARGLGYYADSPS